MSEFKKYLQEQLEDPEIRAEYDALDSEFAEIQASIDKSKHTAHISRTSGSTVSAKEIISVDYIKLSKEISYALRHAPWKYELELDGEGFVPVNQLIEAINENNKYGRLIELSDIEHAVEVSDKKRHEIQGDRIRALYGHSIPMHISKEPLIPPAVLYHGTTHKALASIIESGLKPMGRQYVHLSTDTEMAIQVGSRRDSDPVILKIDAERAYRNNIRFYKGNDRVVLADYIPPQYISY